MLLFTQYKTIRGLPLSAVSLSRCITCQDICVQQSHAGSHSVISNKPRLHNEINRYAYNKNRLSPAWGQWWPAPPCAPISCLAPGLLHTSNIVFKNVAPCGFCPPCCKILATGLNKNRENLCYEQKHMSVLIWFETIIECWLNYIPSSKFSSATHTLNIWKTFFVAQDVFHNAVNIHRWWDHSLIVGVHLLPN